MEKEDDSRKWKTLKSDIIVSRPPWLRVRHDEVQLPDGRVNPEFYVLEYPDWVNVIAITDDGHMVMEMQYRYGLGETCVEICAGVIEEGETPEQAARRELEEETGYTGGVWEKWMTISGNPSTTNNLTHCFIANFAPRKLKGVESQGMILSAQDADGRLVVISPTGEVRPGSSVS